MKLYDINESIINAMEYGVDDETGEILSQEELNKKLDELQIALNDKLEGIALYSKQLDYDVADFDKEIQNLKYRKDLAEKKREGLNRFLSTYLLNNGYEKGFSTSKVNVKFRKSTQVIVSDDIDNIPEEFITTKIEKSVDKKGIKELLKTQELPYAKLQTNINLNIK